MSADENKARIRRLLEEGMNKGNESVIDELIAPNYVSADEAMSAVGPEGFKAIVSGFRTAFPDGQLVIQDIIAEGDTVITWGIFKGTHQGPLEGFPPTGKQVTVKDVDLWRLEHGRVVESRTHFDQLGMMRQLGVLGAMTEEKE
jgi:steroid delta-isomerase-like uncharacterized protein